MNPWGPAPPSYTTSMRESMKSYFTRDSSSQWVSKPVNGKRFKGTVSVMGSPPTSLRRGGETQTTEKASAAKSHDKARLSPAKID